jgi:hypothetical protein
MSAIMRAGALVKVWSIFQPCFLAVERTDRITVKSFAIIAFIGMIYEVSSAGKEGQTWTRQHLHLGVPVLDYWTELSAACCARTWLWPVSVKQVVARNL